MATQANDYPRFTLAQRLEHWVMSLSFTVLMITGLPQRYALAGWAEAMITAMGGIESVRIIHRVAAVIFMVVMIYHFIVVAYKIFVLRLSLTMLPALADGKDIIHSLRYYLGLTPDHPKLPRYNYAEKIEYWAVIWGGVLMTITGFMLWNPIASSRLLPGQFIPAARAAHSAEALLAFLAIIIWHVYWVHFKTFNRAMFTGRLTRQQMALEHAAELEEIEAGRTTSPPPAATLRRRRRLFAPITTVVTAISLIGLYTFVTFEQTAITTVPPGSTAQAVVFATATPAPTPAPTATPDAMNETGAIIPVSVPIIPHPLGGREECLECHATDGPLPYPPDHQNYELSLCQFCHSLDEERPAPKPVRHSLVEREQCTFCHAIDLQPESHREADFSDRECLRCHAIE
jgi:formate dehydrogenase gamma subunit